MIDPTVVAIPMYIGLMIAESASFRFWPNKNQRGYGKKDAAISISMGLGSLGVAAIFGILTFGVYSWVYQYRIFDIGNQMGALSGVALIAAWALLVVVDDFGYYWFHRVHHESRFFWAAHVTHHSSQYYNLSTALRQSWTPLTAMLFYVPVFLLGFTPTQWALVHGFNLLFQFWIHTERINLFPRWFEAVFNTPSHHRVHHGSNPEYIDRNYAGILISWDRIFGSFTLEKNQVKYGLTKNIPVTFNLPYVAFHEFLAIGRDVRSTTSIREMWGYTFKRPGWQPTPKITAGAVDPVAAVTSRSGGDPADGNDH